MVINSSKELAELLGVSTSVISRWVSKGMPCNIGEGLKSYSFELEAVLKWLSAYTPKHKKFVEELYIKWSMGDERSKESQSS